MGSETERLRTKIVAMIRERAGRALDDALDARVDSDEECALERVGEAMHDLANEIEALP